MSRAGNPPCSQFHEPMKFTPQQIAILRTPDPRIAVLAGPGSGKTTTLVGRLINDFKTGHALPDSTAVITFTNAAADEMRARLERVGCQMPNYVGTLHGWCLREIQTGGQITVLPEALAEEILEHVIAENRIGTTAERVRKVLGGQKGDAKTDLAIKLYRKTLAASNAVDYDLILVRALEWIEANSCATSHLYVDEYQDSGQIDAQIYDAMNPHTAFFVGDVDQAIYGFRGGTPENLRAIANQSGTTVFKLEDNWRSVPAICAAANAVIAHNRERFDKCIVPQRPAHAEPAITAEMFRGELAETVEISGRIAAMLRRMEPKDVAVLVRYNADKDAFSDALSGLGVPVAGARERLPGDWHRAQAAVNAMATPGNVMAVIGWRMAAGESWANASATVEALARRSASLMPEYMLGVAGRSYEANRERILHGLRQDGISGGTLRLLDSLKPSDLPSLLIAMREASGATSEGVTVSTYHSAKGLEWPVVFMPACEDRMVRSNVEEDRRLFFVAITRARDRLHLSAADQRRVAWGAKRMEPTGGMIRFVNEMNLPKP